ncbi:B3 domain-containing protein REM12-like [Eutrema salsugineum]|uniref:B3 domain-containing protein REM12-like n=1 Tax=Eutrema salsugineum TaxID=72664 RepID=UPI000CECF5D5|nr:B3 domain-containing protein REM12-like [Eutrema salsugineum]
MSGLGLSCCQIQDIPASSSDNDREKIEIARNKKAKVNNSVTESDPCSSDHSCSVALETASNLQKDVPCLPSSQNQFMTLRVAPNSLISGRQYLAMSFMRKHGITKLGPISMIGKNGTKWLVNVRGEALGKSLCLGKGWKNFAKANGLEPGRLFTLELVWENELPMLKLFYTDGDIKHKGESSKAKETDEFNIDETSNSLSLIQNRLVDISTCT